LHLSLYLLSGVQCTVCIDTVPVVRKFTWVQLFTFKISSVANDNRLGGKDIHLGGQLGFHSVGLRCADIRTLKKDVTNVATCFRRLVEELLSASP
jgi:hypothetical protein